MYFLTLSYIFPAVFNSTLSLHVYGLDLDTSHREEISEPQCSCCITRHVDERYMEL